MTNDEEGNMKQLRLTSTELVHTPGVFKWLVCMFETEDADKAVEIFANGYPSLGLEVARGLLSGDIGHTVEGDAIIVDPLEEGN